MLRSLRGRVGQWYFGYCYAFETLDVPPRPSPQTRKQEFAGVGDHGRPRNAEFERLLAGATSDVDEALKFLDVVKADDVAVRRARKVQVSAFFRAGTFVTKTTEPVSVARGGVGDGGDNYCTTITLNACDCCVRFVLFVCLFVCFSLLGTA